MGQLPSSLVHESDIFYTPCAASTNGFKDPLKSWNAALKSYAPSENKSTMKYEDLLKYADAMKKINIRYPEPKISQSNDFKLGVNFEGNIGNGSVPPDNTIAVSTNGYIVSSINSNILIMQTDGKILLSKSLEDFFIELDIFRGHFDPRVLFDVKERRFILVALSGSIGSQSTISIAFSKGEDPSLGWNFYKLKGDLLNENLWFDYPKIGITNDDLFISGNMFTSVENDFKYSAVYQISKKEGYQGIQIRTKHYTKMKSPVNQDKNLFNLTPVNNAWKDTSSSEMMFLTNVPSGGTQFLLSSISSFSNLNPTYKIINIFNAPSEYIVSGLVPQKNTETQFLQTGDCRIQYCLLHEKIIHFVFNSRTNEKAGIFIGRYNLDNEILYVSRYYEEEYDVAYPSIAGIDATETGISLVLHYLRSSKEAFPHNAFTIISGRNDDFQFSSPSLIKGGNTFVDALDGNNERWGDYSCVGSRYYMGSAEAWAGGCFGKGPFGTWIGQITKQNYVSSEIFADKTVINSGDTIKLYYVSNDSIIDVIWKVEGGVIDENFALNKQVRYDSIGSFNMEAVFINSKGDSVKILKENFINVIPKVFAPQAEFYADKTVTFVGDSVGFFDLSTNNPTTWKWVITGSDVGISKLQNPKVVYNKTGNYNVILSVKNSAGQSLKQKQKYISIIEKVVKPIADFSANSLDILEGDSIKFTDLSFNKPVKWEWFFISNFDTIKSELQNPIIIFNKMGIYDVTLIAHNEAGIDTLTKENFIVVGVSSNSSEFILNPKFYPNPVSNGRLYLEFELSQKLQLTFYIYSEDGKLIKTIYSKQAQNGNYQFSFDSEMLTKGKYILMIRDNYHRSWGVTFVRI